MAKANLGSYNDAMFEQAKKSDNRSRNWDWNPSGWERDDSQPSDKTNVDSSKSGDDEFKGAPWALPEADVLPDKWANYNDPYANFLLGNDKPGGANTGDLSESDINRLGAKDVKSFGVRDYDAYGPINRMIRWGTSGLKKQSKDEYYAEHLQSARNEDEQNLIKKAESLGMPMPEGDLWADNDTLYKEFAEDMKQEEGFRGYKESDEYKRLSNLSGGIDTNNDGKIDVRDDKSMQFDVKDLTREDYETKSAEWLTNLNKEKEKDATASWADKGVPPEVHKYMRDNPGIGMSDAMRQWHEVDSPEAKRKIKDQERAYKIARLGDSGEFEMQDAQERFDSLLKGHVNEDGSPMLKDESDKYQIKLDNEKAAKDAEAAQKLLDFQNNDPYGRTPERVAQENASRERLMGPSLTDTSNIKKIEPTSEIRDLTFKDNLKLKSQGLKNFATKIFGNPIRNNDKSGKKSSPNANPAFASKNPYGNIKNVTGGTKTTTTTTSTYNPSKDEKKLAAYKQNIAKSDKTERDPGRTLDHIMADKAQGYELDMYGNRIEDEYGNFVMASR